MEVVLTEDYTNKIKEQLTELISDVIKKEAEKVNPIKRYYTRVQLQKFLSIGQSSMEQLQQQGLHYVKVGNKHLFDIEEVYQIFEQNKQ